MTFDEFAAAHGLILRHIEYGKWIRVPTTDKPHRKNGAYFHHGTMCIVQNHATMTEPSIWFADKDVSLKIDHYAMRLKMAKADADIRIGRIKAANRAQSILSECVIEQHAYLDSKGFSDTKGLVYYQDDGDNLFAIPMRIKNALVGVQLINRNGDKKFLYGQQCKNATYKIGRGEFNIFCEGYATGLSIQAVTGALHLDCTIHVCFSDSNLSCVAMSINKGIVIADNDASMAGERAAIKTGLNYYMPDTIGCDFNDQHKSLGLFAISQIFKKFLHTIHKVG